MFFWNSLAFSIIQWMLAIWSLVPLPCLKPAGTSGSSWFFFNESVLHISASNENSGLISFRMDWFNLLAIKENLKSLFQPYNWKASILRCSSLLYGPTLTSDPALSLCQVLGAEWARHCPYPPRVSQTSWGSRHTHKREGSCARCLLQVWARVKGDLGEEEEAVGVDGQ